MIGRSMLGLVDPDPEPQGILLVDRPEPHILVLTMNRPDVLNAMSPELEAALARELDAFDRDEDLWVCVIAGKGRLFCAGADLAAWQHRQSSKAAGTETAELLGGAHGFGALSRRTASSKPIIAAVHGGGAYGGGCEIVLNADLVVAEEGAKFALPEALRGVVAAQGGIPRVAAVAGHQLAAEMLFTGRTVSAKEAYERFRFYAFIQDSRTRADNLALSSLRSRARYAPFKLFHAPASQAARQLKARCRGTPLRPWPACPAHNLFCC